MKKKSKGTGSGQSRAHMLKINKATRFSTINQPLNRGRKPKLVSGVIQDLHDLGYEGITPAQVSELLSVLLNLEKAQVKQVADNEQLPIYAQRIARRLYGATEAEIAGFFELQLNRAHGKPAETVNLNGEVALSTYVMPNGTVIEL